LKIQNQVNATLKDTRLNSARLDIPVAISIYLEEAPAFVERLKSGAV